MPQEKSLDTLYEEMVYAEEMAKRAGIKARKETNPDTKAHWERVALRKEEIASVCASLWRKRLSSLVEPVVETLAGE